MTATPASAPKLKYRRLMLKLSGEALAGKTGFGIDVDVLHRLTRQIGEICKLGAEVTVVVGGGNIYRGLEGAASGMDRATADYMGMLATVLNALALQNALENMGTPARVLSAIPMSTVCEAYVRPKALHHLAEGRVVIFAAGTGNPFFTTDTAAVLRAVETNCEVVAKATKVDGVYDKDPVKHPDARRFDRLSHREVLNRNLQVMDTTAIALAQDNKLPIIVFRVEGEDNLMKVVQGAGPGTLVEPT